MKRRAFVAGLRALLVAPSGAASQQAGIPRIGSLSARSTPDPFL